MTNATASAAARPRRVLVVVEAFANSLQSQLASAGYETHTSRIATTPRAISDFNPDIAIIELHRGEISGEYDGLSLARRLRAQPATYALPLVFVWNEDERSIRNAALYVGADDYFPLNAPQSEVMARLDALFWRIEADRRAAPTVGDQRTEIDNFMLMLDAVREDIRAGRTGTMALIYAIPHEGNKTLDKPSRDRTLAKAHGFLKLNLRRADAVSFYGPTTLLVYLPRLSSKSAVAALSRLRGEFLDEGQENDIAIGLASFPADGNDVESLIANAEAAVSIVRAGTETKRIVASGAQEELEGYTISASSIPAPQEVAPKLHLAETQAESADEPSQISDEPVQVFDEPSQISGPFSLPESSPETAQATIQETVQETDFNLTVEPESQSEAESHAEAAPAEAEATALAQTEATAFEPPALVEASVAAKDEIQTPAPPAFVQDFGLDSALDNEILELEPFDVPATEVSRPEAIAENSPVVQTANEAIAEQPFAVATRDEAAHVEVADEDADEVEHEVKNEVARTEPAQVEAVAVEETVSVEVGEAVSVEDEAGTVSDFSAVEVERVALSAQEEEIINSALERVENVPAESVEGETTVAQAAQLEVNQPEAAQATETSEDEAAQAEVKPVETASVHQPATSSAQTRHETRAAAEVAAAHELQLRAQGTVMPRLLLLAVSDITRMAQLNLLVRSAGYEARAAFDSQQALDLLRIERPDLLLLDYAMQGVNGLEALRRLRQQGGGRIRVPVVLLLPENQESVRSEALELGARAVLTMPYDPAQLLAGIRIAASVE